MYGGLLCSAGTSNKQDIHTCIIGTIGIPGAFVAGIEYGGLLCSAGTSMKQGMVQYELL